MPKTCNDCTFFEPEPHTGRGNCHGQPPAMLEAVVDVPHNKRRYIPIRPEVAPSDRACSLFAPVAVAKKFAVVD